MDTLVKKAKRPIIINTTNSLIGPSHWQEKLENCPHFSCVRDFINPVTKNRVKMWISN